MKYLLKRSRAVKVCQTKAQTKGEKIEGCKNPTFACSFFIILIALMACGYGQYPNTRYTHNDFDYQIDSSKYYWKKQVYWEQRMNKELERLNKFKKPQLSQRLLDYQDSSIKFKLLLEKYKK